MFFKQIRLRIEHVDLLAAQERGAQLCGAGAKDKGRSHRSPIGSATPPPFQLSDDCNTTHQFFCVTIAPHENPN
jgi:hypothetical protein